MIKVMQSCFLILVPVGTVGGKCQVLEWVYHSEPCQSLDWKSVITLNQDFYGMKQEYAVNGPNKVCVQVRARSENFRK
jgi:hypothetical protein